MSENETGEAPKYCPLGKLGNEPAQYLCNEKECAWWYESGYIPEEDCCGLLRLIRVIEAGL